MPSTPGMAHAFEGNRPDDEAAHHFWLDEHDGPRKHKNEANTKVDDDEGEEARIPDTAYIQFGKAARGSLTDYMTMHNGTHMGVSSKRAPLCDYDYNNQFGSGVSSVISSPSLSTVSSPLSTPTRFISNLQHFTQKSTKNILGMASSSCEDHTVMPTAPPAAPLSHQQHHSHQRKQHTHMMGPPGGAAKKSQQNVRAEMSPYRQLLPIVLCLLTFVLVFSVLMVYMDSTEIHHQQFRLNMTRDYSLFSVAQDNPELIAFLRLVQLRKYSKQLFEHSKAPPPVSSLAATSSAMPPIDEHASELVTRMATYMAQLLNGKTNGAIIESSTGVLGRTMTSQWFVEQLNWHGIVVEPEPRTFFMLRQRHYNHTQMRIVHACVSPQTYPKEITIHNEEAEMSMNSLLGLDTSWFNSRVKCFPLYSLMLACNRVAYDVLSLGVPGEELQILHTLPFDKIKIELITVHLLEHHEDAREYIDMITRFLVGKSYELRKQFGNNYIYRHVANGTQQVEAKNFVVVDVE